MSTMTRHTMPRAGAQSGLTRVEDRGRRFDRTVRYAARCGRFFAYGKDHAEALANLFLKVAFNNQNL